VCGIDWPSKFASGELANSSCSPSIIFNQSVSLLLLTIYIKKKKKKKKNPQKKNKKKF